MTRLLVDSRTRPEIALPKYLGMSQFSAVPLSLFTPGGLLYYPKDKVTKSQISNCEGLVKCFRHDNQ